MREFVPSSRPGGRLPHGWLGARSTLDLIALDRLTLLGGPDGQPWIEAARSFPAIACVRVDAGDWWSRTAAMGPGGALLVRPDQHVAFRSVNAVEDADAALRAAVLQVLGAEMNGDEWR